jgi:ABC-type phosphate transport system substrate-binding protein
MFAQEGYKVIVNSDNSVESLSAKEVSKIFLKKTTKWSDGTKIVPVDQESDNAARKNFTKSVHNKSVAAIKAYWQKKIFSGRGVPPAEKKSSRDVVSYVKQNPGAIGYVSVKTNVQGVKVIDVTN